MHEFASQIRHHSFMDEKLFFGCSVFTTPREKDNVPSIQQ